MSWICKECNKSISKAAIRWEHSDGQTCRHIIIPVKVSAEKKRYSVEELIELQNEFLSNNFKRPDIIDFLTWLAEREKV